MFVCDHISSNIIWPSVTHFNARIQVQCKLSKSNQTDILHLGNISKLTFYL